ncbi:hypothetical protein NP233_g12159 [Leucocoprinus birnbaumii]|uniref:Uncharacterized protein n=1 Tax=Leucocoprinus birnbaumii TaxID=56174 RepID=A0AAD5YQ99_9AGAR|nr:hypothetical protein NP233_g12159 [Leucocoprinus birnbaumii]
MNKPQTKSSWRRKTSKYASTWQWKTTYIFEYENLADGANDFDMAFRGGMTKLLIAMDAFEVALLEDISFMTYVGESPTDSVPVSQLEQTKVLKAIHAYKFIDSLAWGLCEKYTLASTSASPKAPKQLSKMLSSKSQGWSTATGLSEINWDEHIQQGLNAFNSSTSHTNEEGLPDITDTRSILYHMVQHSREGIRSTIISNFAGLAFYISYLADQISIDLPDQPSDLMTKIGFRPTQLNLAGRIYTNLPDQPSDLTTTTELKPLQLKLDPSFNFMTPAIMTTLFTPIVLFGPINYCYQSMYNTTWARIWFRSSMAIPEAVIDLEKQSIKAACSIAFHRRKPEDVLTELWSTVKVPATNIISAIKYCPWEHVDEKNSGSLYNSVHRGLPSPDPSIQEGGIHNAREEEEEEEDNDDDNYNEEGLGDTEKCNAGGTPPFCGTEIEPGIASCHINNQVNEELGRVHHAGKERGGHDVMRRRRNMRLSTKVTRRGKRVKALVARRVFAKVANDDEEHERRVVGEASDDRDREGESLSVESTEEVVVEGVGIQGGKGIPKSGSDGDSEEESETDVGGKDVRESNDNDEVCDANIGGEGVPESDNDEEQEKRKTKAGEEGDDIEDEEEEEEEDKDKGEGISDIDTVNQRDENGENEIESTEGDMRIEGHDVRGEPFSDDDDERLTDKDREQKQGRSGFNDEDQDMDDPHPTVSMHLTRSSSRKRRISNDKPPPTVTKRLRTHVPDPSPFSQASRRTGRIATQKSLKPAMAARMPVKSTKVDRPFQTNYDAEPFTNKQHSQLNETVKQKKKGVEPPAQPVKTHERAWPKVQKLDPLPQERYIPKIGLPVYDYINNTVEHVHLKCHHQKDADFFEEVAKSLHNGISPEKLKPKKLEDLNSKFLKVFTFEEFCKATIQEILDVWRDRNILVVDVDKLKDGSPENFDAEAFSRRCPAIENQTLEIHGQSFDSRMTHVAVADFIDCASANPEKQRIVNALDIPNTDDSPGMPVDIKMAGQEAAWKVSQNSRAPGLCWHLAATAGAHTHWHFDSDGLGTAVHGDHGGKIWSVGSFTTKSGIQMADRKAFVNLDTQRINDDLIDSTHICLRYGMTFFTSGKTITNVSHAETVHNWLRGILNAVLITHPYPPKDKIRGKHRDLIPKIDTADGINAIHHVCSILFLGSAVFPEAYRNRTSLSFDLRERFMNGRSLAIRVAHLILQNTQLYIDGQLVPFWDGWFFMFIARQAAAVYNNLHERLAIPEVNNTTAVRFKAKIKTLGAEYDAFGRAMAVVWKLNEKSPIGDFDWGESTIKIIFVEPECYDTEVPGELDFGASANEWYFGSRYTAIGS